MRNAVLVSGHDAYNLDVQSPIFQIMSQQPEFPITKMVFDDMTLVFNVPYAMTIQHDGEYFTHENTKLNLVVSGKTLNELADEFFEAFHFLWKGYALENDKSLSSDARKLKQTLLQMIKAENK